LAVKVLMHNTASQASFSPFSPGKRDIDTFGKAISQTSNHLQSLSLMRNLNVAAI